MQKLTRLVIFLVLAVLLALWSPWADFDISVFDFIRPDPNSRSATMQVSSLAGEIEVYIDDNLEPVTTVTPDNSPSVLPGIAPGQHQVRLVRSSEGSYWEYNRIIEFAAGVDVILAYELGPTKEFSGGHLIYASPNESATNKAKLFVDSNVPETNVTLNGAQISTTPIDGYELGLDAQQRLGVFKPGYESQEFLLFPEEQSDRDKLAGFDLYVEVQLFLQPLPVEEI